MELSEILTDPKKKEIAINRMAETILNEDLTSKEALDKDLWLILDYEIKENGTDKYFGDLPEDIKEKAITLAEEKKKNQTIPGFYDDYVVNEIANQILQENIGPLNSLKKIWTIRGTDTNNNYKVYDGPIPEFLVMRALAIVKKRKEKGSYK